EGRKDTRLRFPKRLKLERGKTYYYCTCGYSKVTRTCYPVNHANQSFYRNNHLLTKFVNKKTVDAKRNHLLQILNKNTIICVAVKKRVCIILIGKFIHRL